MDALFALKGRNRIAQGNALGSAEHPEPQALKGRDRGRSPARFCTALSGLVTVFRAPSSFPGRCPGLTCPTLSGCRFVEPGSFE